MTMSSFCRWETKEKSCDQRTTLPLLFFPRLFRIWTVTMQHRIGCLVYCQICKKTEKTYILLGTMQKDRGALDFPLKHFLTTLSTLILIYFSRTRQETLKGEVPIALWGGREYTGGCYYQALHRHFCGLNAFYCFLLAKSQALWLSSSGKMWA